MKLWQLLSLLRAHDDRARARDVIAARPEWREILDGFDRSAELIHGQDRDALDAELPTPLAREALSVSTLRLFVSRDGQWLRSHSKDDAKQQIDIVEAFDRFGANAVEDAFEYGSTPVTT